MIKWGILGLGNMANKFAEAILEVENAKLVSISSLSKKKLNRLVENLISMKDTDSIHTKN